MDWAVQLCELNYGEEEIQAVGKVLQRKWLTIGEETIKFETEFAKFIGSKNPGVFTSSGQPATFDINGIGDKTK